MENLRLELSGLDASLIGKILAVVAESVHDAGEIIVELSSSVEV